VLIFPTPPSTNDGIISYVNALNTTLEELNRPELQHFQLEEWNYEPGNKVQNMVVMADGTNWNPGSGRGMYRYEAASDTWVFIA